MRTAVRKVSILCIMFAMIISFIIPYQGAAFQGEDTFFMRDISGHWAEDDIKELSYMAILNGDNDKNANPDRSITRAEFTALLVRALNNEKDRIDGGAGFSDVKPEDWYYTIVSIAKEKGITQGNGTGKFLPNRQITREEIVLMLVRAMGLEGESLEIDFKDIKNNYKYEKELSAALKSNIINGYKDNTFRPSKNASRAEAAVMIKRMLSISDPSMDQASEEKEMELLIKDYLTQYVDKKNRKDTELDFNVMHSIGKAENDNRVKSQAIQLYKENGINVWESIDHLEVQVTEITKGIAKAVARYEATYTRHFEDGSNRVKTYQAEEKFSLRKVKDKWKIYDVQERLYQDEKINLTWEQIAVKTPDMSGVPQMKGLDIISSTWFELRNSDNALGVKASDPVVYQDWQTNIHMIDMGDQQFMKWAHQHGYDVWGLFRNEFDIEVANKVLNSKESRKECIELLLQYVNNYKLDGINIDFENVYYEDRNVLSQLVRELAPVLREQGVITSVDVTKIEPTSWTWSMCYDRKALGEAADYIAFMAYDQNGSWSKKSGSVAQYTWVEKGLQGIIEQVPNEKVLLGLPFYNRLWEEVNGKVTGTRAISMQEAQHLIHSHSADVVWDRQSGQYFATYRKGNKTYKMWVEDAHSINLKSSLVHKYELAGTASWRRGYETPDIWNVLYDNLKKYHSYDAWVKGSSMKWYWSKN